MDKYFSWERLWKVIPKLNEYLPVTIKIALIAILLGTVLGIFVAAIRIYKIPVLSRFFHGYTTVMRGIPFVVLVFLVYFCLPFLAEKLFGVDINNWEKMIFVEIAYALNQSAFVGEIFRGAFESVSKLQSEAAYSVGMNEIQTFFRIILPQAVKVAIPMYGINVVWLFEETSVTYMLGMTDFLGKAKELGSAIGHSLEAYIYVAFVYTVISIALKSFFKLVDKKYTFGY